MNVVPVNAMLVFSRMADEGMNRLSAHNVDLMICDSIRQQRFKKEYNFTPLKLFCCTDVTMPLSHSAKGSNQKVNLIFDECSCVFISKASLFHLYYMVCLL